MTLAEGRYSSRRSVSSGAVRAAHAASLHGELRALYRALAALLVRERRARTGEPRPIGQRSRSQLCSVCSACSACRCTAATCSSCPYVPAARVTCGAAEQRGEATRGAKLHYSGKFSALRSWCSHAARRHARGSAAAVRCPSLQGTRLAGQRAAGAARCASRESRARHLQGSDPAGATKCSAVLREPAGSRSAGRVGVVLDAPGSGAPVPHALHESLAAAAEQLAVCCATLAKQRCSSRRSSCSPCGFQIIWLSSCCSGTAPAEKGTALAAVAMLVLHQHTPCCDGVVRGTAVALPELQLHSPSCNGKACVTAAHPVLLWYSPCCSSKAAI